MQQKNMMETTWTSVNNMNTARSLALAGFGTQTAALAFTGYSTNRNYSSNRRI
jgi:hypothetical protein